MGWRTRAFLRGIARVFSFGRPLPARSEFKQRCDAAERIPRWEDRMDALLVLIVEDPTEYAEWAREKHA